MTTTPTIIYTKTDEAPALATYSFLPIVEAFTRGTGIEVCTRDISLAGRILAVFPDCLEEAQGDHLKELGELAQKPEANIIKLPNISASVPQLKAAIAELQAQGFAIPDYPEDPTTAAERATKKRYDKVKGSAVNPVLREGNSDRRAPRAVKEFARNNPHSMGAWSPDSKSHVATMGRDDFRSNEKSCTLDAPTTARILHRTEDGKETTLKEGIALEAGEIIDASFLSKRALIAFLNEQIEDARNSGVLFSLHMKATMMKVSDPIIFGHAVRSFFSDLFERHAQSFERIGVDPNNGLGDLLTKIDALPAAEKEAVLGGLEAAYDKGPALAMVNSDRGITNLHVPSDVIIDASMPAMIRTSGRMWNAQGETQDTKAVIPDSSYAGIYSAVFDDCKANGAYDPRSMGSVSNVGLMAKKAEEYGSHDKTFEMTAEGEINVIGSDGEVLLSHRVEAGDIWRMCQVKDAPVRDWVGLAVRRARMTGAPAVFWLDENRAHDRELIRKVKAYLPQHNTEGLDFPILAPIEACTFSCARIRKGQDTISVTGNVLRDYLTDLFPILEVGTSAKMLSIVPLMNGGGLFETGAGGSAPKHVQQFVEEGHLRWDSLGEFLALAASFDHIKDQYDHSAAGILSATLDEATTQYLLRNKAPSRKVKEMDNRGSHVYLATFWAEALAEQGEDPDLAARFAGLAEKLKAAETVIQDELIEAQGQAVELRGYYRPDETRAGDAMRPSATFNRILAEF